MRLRGRGQGDTHACGTKGPGRLVVDGEIELVDHVAPVVGLKSGTAEHPDEDLVSCGAIHGHSQKMLAAHDKQTRTTEGDLGGGPAGVSTAAVLDGRGTTVGKLVRDLEAIDLHGTSWA